MNFLELQQTKEVSLLSETINETFPNGTLGQTKRTRGWYQTANESHDFNRQHFKLGVPNESYGVIYAVFIANWGHSTHSDYGNPDTWIVNTGGPNLMSLPTGTHEYIGHTLIWRKSNKVHWDTRIPDSRFDLSVDFEVGEGSITSTHLSGNININLEDGTFMHGDTMNLKETADSENDSC